MVRIDHPVGCPTVHCVGVKTTEKEVLALRCPTCGSKSGEKCILSTGLPRTEPHRDRRLAALENKMCRPSESRRRK